MPLTLVQLETFARLALERSFTRTAEQLHLTQPAVTQQIRSLERHFGVKLVDLIGRKIVLTDAGRFLAARSVTMLGNAAALEREMRALAEARAGDLRIGATLTIGSYALPALLARYHATHPNVDVSIRIENTRDIAHALKAGAVSLALVEGPLADDDLDIATYAEDELILIVPASHPFAKKRRGIAAVDLSEAPFVFREEGSGTRLQTERALLDAGVAVRTALVIPSGEGIVRAVASNLGVAFVSRLVAEDQVRDGRVVRVHVRDLDLRRIFRVARVRQQTPSAAASAFLALLASPP